MWDWWLNSVDAYAPGAPVIIVGTKIDLLTDDQVNELQHRINTSIEVRNIRSRFKQICNVLLMSSKNGGGVDEVHKAIIKASLTLSDLQDMIPVNWNKLKERLEKWQNRSTFKLPAHVKDEDSDEDDEEEENERENNSNSRSSSSSVSNCESEPIYVPLPLRLRFDEYVKSIEDLFPNENDEEKISEIKTATGLMHKLGLLVWFENVEHLSDFVFPQPQVLLDAMKLIISSKKHRGTYAWHLKTNKELEKGYLPVNVLNDIWEP